MRKIATLYLLFFIPSLCPQSEAPRWPMFRKHLLDGGANESAAVADINRDGRLDIIAGESWYEAPQWKKHRIREIQPPRLHRGGCGFP